jgi:aspartate aminotransferase
MTQWKELSALFLEKKLIPFFDFAYQGFGQDLEKDAEAIRFFAGEGHEMLVANSFAKNFALYAERAGGLFIVTTSEQTAERVSSKLKVLIRTNYSNPPLHGAHIVSHILASPSLRKRWEEELEEMRERIIEMRLSLADAFAAKTKKLDFSYFKDRNGMFCFSGLTKPQVDSLIADYGIYMTSDGRINLAGLSKENLPYVVDCITTVLA